MQVYVNVFGSLRHWWCEVRTLDHERLHLGVPRPDNCAAETDARQYVRDHALEVVDQPLTWRAPQQPACDAAANPCVPCPRG